MRRQVEVANEVAAALSGSNDQILRAGQLGRDFVGKL